MLAVHFEIDGCQGSTGQKKIRTLFEVLLVLVEQVAQTTCFAETLGSS
jgi:hypothetical protein